MKTQTKIDTNRFIDQTLPSNVKTPTKETQKALNELKTRDGKTFKNVNALFDDLDN